MLAAAHTIDVFVDSFWHWFVVPSICSILFLAVFGLLVHLNFLKTYVMSVMGRFFIYTLWTTGPIGLGIVLTMVAISKLGITVIRASFGDLPDFPDQTSTPLDSHLLGGLMWLGMAVAFGWYAWVGSRRAVVSWHDLNFFSKEGQQSSTKGAGLYVAAIRSVVIEATCWGTSLLLGTLLLIGLAFFFIVGI